jgi:hypothetical protein
MSDFIEMRYVARTQRMQQKVVEALARQSFSSLKQAAFDLRILAITSIKKGKGSSSEGDPPRTRGGRGSLPGAILYDADRDALSAIIGPVASRVDTAGRPHEFGGFYKGQNFDERPFMRPALETIQDRLPGYWATTNV